MTVYITTALLARWLTDPSSRDFALDDMVVLTAMTGHESAATISAVTRHMLPLFQAHSVRFIQIGRSQRKTTRAGDGVVVLDDSRFPRELHAEGLYTLGDEMRSAATLPQRGGARLCSVHSKGDLLDPVIARITRGRPFRHVIGFEANERARADKDRLFDTELRTGWYPLRDWGWTRADCHDFVVDTFGESIPKSCCGFCVFAMSTANGRAATVQRYRQEPELGVEALVLEQLARSINPSQTLIEGSSAADLVATAGLTEVQQRVEAHLETCEWSLYEVRRLVRPGRSGGKGITARSLRVAATGSRDQMARQLAGQPGRRVQGPDGIVRHILRDRATDSSRVDHLYVAAPAGGQDKQRSGFEQWWQESTGDALF
ncbi:Uncharacterised protein [Mycobacteroides abscessus subsp. massiliense]|uniref:hypothetical protein n=1 Tax=Mycobacteroides abscessus TaxID=36809 RepID=UPI0009A5F06B|nr:hypothetical protein [Mycobacteroides abscessus]SKK90505.1 Uncharacterised protein [Mycobacteroides abscessus subsp. massiliense]